MKMVRRCEKEWETVGYILPKIEDPPRNDNEEDSETEQEDNAPEFLDMKEMHSVYSGGGILKESKHIVRTQVRLHDVQCGEQHLVEGKFVLQDPWWEVTCIVRRWGKKLVLKQPPSYRLQPNPGRDVLALFLKACGVHDDHLMLFSQWLPTEVQVNFTNLHDVLDKFSRSENGANKEVMQQIETCLTCSVAALQVQAGTLYPQVMRYLPTLLPNHFLLLLQEGRRSSAAPQTEALEQMEDHSLLGKLENMIKTEVWKLGFGCILQHELRLVRCEATLKALQICGQFEQIPGLQQDALRVYTWLKQHCHSTGSTCVELLELQRNMAKCKLQKAIDFLKEKHVVVVQQNRSVALRNLYRYETDIAKCLACLVDGEPWCIDLDFSNIIRISQEETEKDVAKGDSAVGRAEEDMVGVGKLVSSCYGTGTQGHRVHVQPGSAQVQPMSSCVEPDGIHLESDHIKPGFSHEVRGPVLECPTYGQHLETNPSSRQMKMDLEQMQAVKMICANPVTIISGKGGCGKTTVVGMVIKAFLEQERRKVREEVENACRDFENDSGTSRDWDVPVCCPNQTQQKNLESGYVEVLLTAPTGRAASLMAKKTNFEAYTLHQVWWSFMNVMKDRDKKHKAWKFSSVRVLVVDEGSLVCTQILSSVLKMLTEHAQLKKFIMLGDVRQLPSIEPGNAFSDLFHSLLHVGWAIELKTNHRAESELIVRNAEIISETHRWMPDSLMFDTVVDMKSPFLMPTLDTHFVLVLLRPDIELSASLRDAIIFLLKDGPGLKNDRSSQFIAFRRNECEHINHLCCQHYSGHFTRNHKNRQMLQPGDKVCCTRNGYVSVRKTKPSSEKSQNDDGDIVNERVRLCNGEIFIITQDRTIQGPASQDKKRELMLDDREGHIFTANYKELQRECKLKHAWARTIHTFQGSEAETIVYVLGDGRGHTWRHVYTAVTRGQKRVYVLATEKAKESVEIKRRTWLQGLVEQLFTQRKGDTDPQTWPEDAQQGLAALGGPAPGFGPSHYEKQSPSTHLQTGETRISALTGDAGHYEDSVDMDAQPNCSRVGAEAEGLFRTEEITPRGHTGSKRLNAGECSTPSKRIREAETKDSPLGTSLLRSLSLDGPVHQKKRLFQAEPSDD